MAYAKLVAAVAVSSVVMSSWALPFGPALAHPRHHHPRQRLIAQPWTEWGNIVDRQTARAQLEPGLTHELAPDSRQTATGGPVGGVPGFSGP